MSYFLVGDRGATIFSSAEVASGRRQVPDLARVRLLVSTNGYLSSRDFDYAPKRSSFFVHDVVRALPRVQLSGR
jgi:hypothetical protein